jgi:hypothetical protein
VRWGSKVLPILYDVIEAWVWGEVVVLAAGHDVEVWLVYGPRSVPMSIGLESEMGGGPNSEVR